MAEGVLFNIAGEIIKSLGSLAAEGTRLLWGIEDELEKLQDIVSTIKTVLLHAEEQQDTNPAIRDWLSELNDVIYEADDLLDAVSTYALQQEMMAEDKKAKKVQIFFLRTNRFAFRLEMGYKIKAVRERLDAIKANRGFHLEERHVEKKVRDRERDNTHSRVRVDEVIGRENDKEAIIESLLDSNTEGNVSILPIVGIGGLGKTTLAQLIFNDKRIQKNYELKMWVCVSDVFIVKAIVEKILESATKEKPKTVEMDTLTYQLQKEINGKRYFLVLDDVWIEDHGKWFELKKLLMDGAKGSRILITTRSGKVAEITHTIDPYFLKGLEEKAAWDLFKTMAFKNGQEPKNSSIKEIGRDILKKCAGVPLAVRTMGRLLYFTDSESEWLAFRDNELSKIPQNNESDILPTLKLSYNKLPSHLKHCFAYCSLFPKDYEINKSMLINLWIAQGFVESSSKNQCLEDIGHEYFMDLLWRSFFQEVEMDKFGNVIGCKIHDLMHDLAILVAGPLVTTFDYKNKNLNKKTRHISIGGGINFSSTELVSLYKASMLRTLLCPSSFDFKGEIDCKEIFSRFKFLRALYMRKRKLKCVPSSIGQLKHLRYLDLSENNGIVKLPNSVTRLLNLHTLKLSDCRLLEELPRDINKLVNLRHLEIDGCWKLRYMPRGLGQLINLQSLSLFVIDSSFLSMHSGGLNELNALNNLKGELSIYDISHAKGGLSEYEAANLKEKSHLNSLDLRWSIEGDVKSFDSSVSLKGFQPHPNLKRLRLKYYQGSRLPTWLSSLTNLVELIVHGCKRCQYLPPLSQLSSLKFLRLEDMDYLQYISYDGDKNDLSTTLGSTVIFPSLQEIFLRKCPNLKGWWREDIATVTSMTKHHLLSMFPRLSKLSIVRCPMLISMPMFPYLEEELYLEGASWKPLQDTMTMNTPTVITSPKLATSSSIPLSKLKRLHLYSIAELETLPNEWLKNLNCLEAFTIQSCHKLKSLSLGIQHLTTLKLLDLGFCPELELGTDEDGMQWQGLKSLLSLKLSGLSRLVSLPLGLKCVTTLQNLEISDCENLIAIPEWIHGCKSLEVLRIVGCSSLTSLPNGLQNLTSLESLQIQYCDELKSLSPGIQHLIALKHLYLGFCPELELANDEDGMQWQGLKSLISLSFKDLPKLVALPLELQHVTTLKNLEISYCQNLTIIPKWIDNFKSLEVLQIVGCTSLTSLPEEVHRLSSLHVLKIVECPILLQRCKSNIGEDWPKIAHISELYIW